MHSNVPHKKIKFIFVAPWGEKSRDFNVDVKIQSDERKTIATLSASDITCTL